MITAQTYPFNATRDLGDGCIQILEAIVEPLYFNRTYPKEGTKKLTFFGYATKEEAPNVAGHNLAISNVPCLGAHTTSTKPDPTNPPYWHLPRPQRFDLIGIAMRPVPIWKISRGEESEYKRMHRVYDEYRRLRGAATYRFFVGLKPYSEGPLDHLLDCSADPWEPITIADRFWPVSMTCAAVKKGRHTKSVITIPSEQIVSLEVTQSEPITTEEDLPLRFYLVGCRFREVC